MSELKLLSRKNCQGCQFGGRVSGIKWRKASLFESPRCGCQNLWQSLFILTAKASNQALAGKHIFEPEREGGVGEGEGVEGLWREGGAGEGVRAVEQM